MADDQKPKPETPKPPKKMVWVACRATPGCEGKQATVVFSKKTPGGGSVTRYKCGTCGGAFHIKV